MPAVAITLPPSSMAVASVAAALVQRDRIADTVVPAAAFRRSGGLGCDAVRAVWRSSRRDLVQQGACGDGVFLAEAGSRHGAEHGEIVSFQIPDDPVVTWIRKGLELLGHGDALHCCF